MQVGDLVRMRCYPSIGVVTSFGNGYATVRWLDDGSWSWEDSRDLQAVKKCP